MHKNLQSEDILAHHNIKGLFEGEEKKNLVLWSGLELGLG